MYEPFKKKSTEIVFFFFLRVLYRTGFHNKILPWTPGHFDLRFQNRSALDNYVGNNYCVCTNNYRAKSSGQFMLLYLHKCFGNTCRTLVIDLLRWYKLITLVNIQFSIVP
ncbi:uncharacterized protein OCT59_026824 [Rhizophagus irregularis]|uniref:uncharacterized protein n=1 Tax=Rhizophagus irregularis TaxID=588596 RepID=UPI00331FE999|nr:hypothetical protein OCT59_026824 [Rhizophagus irregularis]